LKSLSWLGIIPALLLAARLYQPGKQVAQLANTAVRESSGLAASWRSPGLFWTHNDSGGLPVLYLFDLSGRDLGTWAVNGARNRDWEDIAIGPGPKRGTPYLYIGDIGDNQRVRDGVTVYRVPEPDTKGPGRETAKAEEIRLRYPEGPRDSEALAVHPQTGDLYLITKGSGDAGTEVFRARAPLRAGDPISLERVGTIALPLEFDLGYLTGRVTGAAISPDGRSVVVCDYLRAYEADVPQGRTLSEAWPTKFHVIDPGPRKQGEAVTYSRDGKTILLTSEGAPCPLFAVSRQ
jgi:hypothetical protein